MSDTAAGAEILTRLYTTIESRRGGDAETSYTASLFAAGLKDIAAKISEEAGETVHAALHEDAGALAAESADLLYHLMVLWAAAGVRPEDVYAALARREGVSGHVEKAGRGRGPEQF
ncbi:MAG: phosphoribosyl-ATP diphosphatase [Rhodospirillales bacterium]